MSEKIIVPLGDRSYPIIISSANLPTLGGELASIAFPSRVALVSNTTVYDLYGAEVENSLKKSGFKVTLVCLPDGEEYKTTETVNSIYDVLIREGFDRTSGLVALGGGVVGDIAGFAAATFLRGIPYVQVPTTLLAQVDSSVGGKTGVNHPLGKNLIGAFFQPRMVFIDVDTLKDFAVPGIFSWHGRGDQVWDDLGCGVFLLDSKKPGKIGSSGRGNSH